MVIVAWATGYPLGLLFDPFESIALYLAGMCFLIDVVRPPINTPILCSAHFRRTGSYCVFS